MRLIDADAFEVVTTKIPDGVDAESYMAGMDFVLNKIDDAPTIEPERAEGEWIPFDVEYECSHCGIILNFYEGSPKANNANFCPNCGAKMGEAEC